MKITQIRNATILIEFGGFRFLVDPVLADKDSYPGFPGTYNDHLRWPKVGLSKVQYCCYAGELKKMVPGDL